MSSAGVAKTCCRVSFKIDVVNDPVTASAGTSTYTTEGSDAEYSMLSTDNEGVGPMASVETQGANPRASVDTSGVLCCGDPKASVETKGFAHDSTASIDTEECGLSLTASVDTEWLTSGCVATTVRDGETVTHTD